MKGWGRIISIPLVLVICCTPNVVTRAQENIPILVEIAWSPDGEMLAVSGRTSEHGKIWLFDVDGRPIDTIVLGEIVTNIRWSHDGSMLAVRYEEEERGQMTLVWDMSALAFDDPLMTFEEVNSANYNHLIWSPSDRYLAIDTSLSVQILDVSTGQLVAELYDPERTGNGAVTGIAWTADEQSLVVAHVVQERNQLLLWDLKTAQVTKTLLSGDIYEFPEAMQASADGEWLAVSIGRSEAVLVLHAPDFKVEREFSFQQEENDDYYLPYLIWSPDNTTLTGLSYDGTGYTWDMQTGGLIAIDDYVPDRNLFISAVAANPYGGQVAMATRRLHSALTPQPTLRNDPRVTTQALVDGMMQIAVIAPSFTRLNSTAELCVRDATDPNAAQVLASSLPVSDSDLEEFLAAVNALPDGTIPAGCRADVIALGERLRTIY